MGTTTQDRPRAGSRSGRESGRAASSATRSTSRSTPDEPREGQYDLLTAAVLGLAVGAGLMMLVSGGRKSSSAIRRMGGKPMSRVAAMAASKAGREGARWAARGARSLADAVDPDAIREQLGEYVSSARDQIDHAVAHEVRDLRRAIRRQRRKLGI